MNLRTFLIISSLILCVRVVYAQDTTAHHAGAHPEPVLSTVTDGQPMSWMRIPEVPVNRKRIFKSPEDKARYLRLRYNVIKVMPYARYAQRRYAKLYEDLAETSGKREQRRLVKACEAEIKDMFNREVKKLTISQGEILIKLIDRQTGSSSYEVVRELRGGFTAFFYQSVARVFGHNLKTEYNPEEEIEIENIIRSLEHRNGGYF